MAGQSRSTGRKQELFENYKWWAFGETFRDVNDCATLILEPVAIGDLEPHPS